MVATVLVVEDEHKLRDLLRSSLERAGFAVLSSGRGAEGLGLAHSARPDLIILDLRLPDIAGEEFTAELRESSDVPILMLTAKTSEQDRIRGFEVGADDYLTKPFSPRELVLRVQAILRRGESRGPRWGESHFGDGEMVIDEARREVCVRGQLIEVTPTEWGLLTSLSSVPGRVYSRAELVNRVRGYEFEGYERTIDSHIKNLRRKIEVNPHAPRIVVTVLGGGYRLGIRRDD